MAFGLHYTLIMLPTWAVALIVVQLLLSLALASLGAYHWAEAVPKQAMYYTVAVSASIVTTGLAASFQAAIGLIFAATKNLTLVTVIFQRLMFIFSVPALLFLLRYIILLSIYVAQWSTFQTPINAFVIAELTISALITLIIVITLYPASVIPIEAGRRLIPLPVRLVVVSLVAANGILTTVYAALSGYGVYVAFDTKTGYEEKVSLSIIALIAAALVIAGTIGAFVGVCTTISYTVPYIVFGFVSFLLFNDGIPAYADFLAYGSADVRYRVYVAMFAFNWAGLAGLAITIPLLGFVALL